MREREGGIGGDGLRQKVESLPDSVGGELVQAVPPLQEQLVSRQILRGLPAQSGAL
jgi:hypothetical protein